MTLRFQTHDHYRGLHSGRSRCGNRPFLQSPPRCWKLSATRERENGTAGCQGVTDRREILALGGLAAAFAALPPQARASVTLTMRSKAELKQYDLKGGYSITVPNDWGLAYDRSGEQELGVQVLFGNFRSFETLSIARVTLDTVGISSTSSPDGVLSGEEWEQVAERIIAEQRDAGGTFSFSTLAKQLRPCSSSSSDGGPSKANGSCPEYYDLEFVVQICRGQIQEGLGGNKRCVGLNDRNLQTVTRHCIVTCTRRGPHMYVVRGSATSERWAKVAADMLAANQSFTL